MKTSTNSKLSSKTGFELRLSKINSPGGFKKFKTYISNHLKNLNDNEIETLCQQMQRYMKMMNNSINN